MAKEAVHYYRDGTRYTGKTHKMPDGSLHSGAVHGRNSEKVFHFKDLSAASKLRAKKRSDV